MGALPKSPPMRYLFAITVAAFLIACSGEPYDYALKECRYDLSQLPTYVEMDPSRRLTFIDACMAKQGWHPTNKCAAVRAEGAAHCAYEKRI
jgi:hypothetical protein